MEQMKEKDKPSDGIIFQRNEPCGGEENHLKLRTSQFRQF